MAEWTVNKGSRYPVELRIGGTEFCLTVAQAMDLLRGAPKLAGRWERVRSSITPDGTSWKRLSALVGGQPKGGGNTAAMAHENMMRSFTSWNYETSKHTGHRNIEDAKAAADAALRAAGWALDDQEGDDHGGEHDDDHRGCECHYLAMLPGGGVHDYCERCDGPRQPIEPLSHPADD